MVAEIALFDRINAIISQHSKRNSKIDELKALRREIDVVPSEDIIKTCLSKARLDRALGDYGGAIAAYEEALAASTSYAQKSQFSARIGDLYRDWLKASDTRSKRAIKQAAGAFMKVHVPSRPRNEGEFNLLVAFTRLVRGRKVELKVIERLEAGRLAPLARTHRLRALTELFRASPSEELATTIGGLLMEPATRMDAVAVEATLAIAAFHYREAQSGRASAAPTQDLDNVLERFLSGEPGADAKRAETALWSLIGNDVLWYDVFEGAPALRSAVARRFWSALENHDLVATETQRRKMVRIVTFLEEFWTDPVEREHWLSRLARLWEDHTPRAQLVNGMIAAVRGQDEAAETLFLTAEANDTAHSLIGSGHSTFVSPGHVDLSGEDGGSDLLSAVKADFNLEFSDEYQAGMPVIITCCDPGYFRRYALVYAKSVRAVAPGAHVHFHVQGDTANLASDITAVRSLSGPFSLSSERPAIVAPYYYACARFLRATEFQRFFDGPILLTDIDVTFRESPEKFIADWRTRGDAGFRVYDAIRQAYISNGSRLMYRYPKIEPWGTLNAACVFINNSESGRRLARILARHTAWTIEHFAANRGSNWWIDQNILFAVIKSVKLSGTANLFNLEETGIPFGAFRPALRGFRVGDHPSFQTALP